MFFEFELSFDFQVSVAPDQSVAQVVKVGVGRGRLHNQPVGPEEQRGESEPVCLEHQLVDVQASRGDVTAQLAQGLNIDAHERRLLLAARIVLERVAKEGRLRVRAIQHALGEVVADVETSSQIE